MNTDRITTVTATRLFIHLSEPSVLTSVSIFVPRLPFHSIGDGADCRGRPPGQPPPITLLSDEEAADAIRELVAGRRIGGTRRRSGFFRRRPTARQSRLRH